MDIIDKLEHIKVVSRKACIADFTDHSDST